MKDWLLNKIEKIKPDNILDIGCGDGSFTVKMTPFCKNITAIDIAPELIGHCKSEKSLSEITYICMDGRKLNFNDNTFDIVIERATLHHSHNWEKVLEEMIRVSSKYILLCEPIDDPRSVEKKNTIYTMEFFSKRENDIGYPHFKHFKEQTLISFFKKKNLTIETEIIKSDKLIDFDDYFKAYDFYVNKSNRKDFFAKRLEVLRKELKGHRLCANDGLYIFAQK